MIDAVDALATLLTTLQLGDSAHRCGLSDQQKLSRTRGETAKERPSTCGDECELSLGRHTRQVVRPSSISGMSHSMRVRQADHQAMHSQRLQRWVEVWHLAYKEYVESVGFPVADEIQTAPPSLDLNSRVFSAINAPVIKCHYFVIKSVLAESLPSGLDSDTSPWDLISEELLRCGEEARSL